MNIWYSKVEQSVRNEKAKVQSKTGKDLLYQMIKEYYGIDLHEEQNPIAKMKHGKPYLRFHPQIHFNISHSEDYAACAVGNLPVGIDIQKRKTEIKESMVRRVLSEKEWNIYTSSENKQKKFYQFWTKKESYLKYTGEGIRKELSTLTYPQCQFFEFQIEEVYAGMVCLPENWNQEIRIQEIQF